MQGITNVSSLGTHTSKAYHIYDEVNNKFIIYRDVIFLESSKIGNVVDWQLNHLDRFTRVKTYHEIGDEILHLKGGIHILDQSL